MYLLLCVQIPYAGFFFEKNCSPLVKSDLLLPEFSRYPHGIALIPTVLALWTLDMKVKGKLFAEKSNDSIGIEITYYSWKVGKKNLCHSSKIKSLLPKVCYYQIWFIFGLG